MTARMQAVFVAVVLLTATVSLAYTTWQTAYQAGHTDGYSDAWSHIPIEQRPPAPLYLGETP